MIICSENFLNKHPELKPQAIEIAGQAMATDDIRLLGGSAIELVGAEMTRRAAKMTYDESGIGPKDVQVVECHDCFSANEMYTRKINGRLIEGSVLMLLGCQSQERLMNSLRMGISLTAENMLLILLAA